MSNRKILFRGFHADVNCNEVIILHGIQVRGKWVIGQLCDFYHKEYDAFLPHICFCNGSLLVVPETIGQYVTTDEFGRDLFEGDIVKSSLDDEIQGVIEFSELSCKFEVHTLDGLDTLYLDDDSWLLIRNKFEVPNE